MPISATTNTSSIVAQRNIAISSDDNSKAMAALSSGSRITRASDGAAEAAIGAKLRSTVSVLSQASRNTSQGASLIQVATDALKNTSNLLTRMKTLTAQVINGSLSDSDKMMAREEFLKLKDLVDNISSQTRWNGISMLGGGAGKAVLARADATVSGSVASVDDPSNVTATYVAAIATADLTGSINGKLASLDVGDYTNGVISAGAISLKMQNGEEFKNEGVVQVTNGGSFKFVSTSNKDNTITINFGADAETGITTLGTFKSKVEAVFQDAVFSGSAQAASGAASNVAADATNGFTSGGTTVAGFVSGLVKDAVVTQDGSKFKVSVTIGNQTFQSTVPAMSNNGTLTLVSASDGENRIILTGGSAAAASMDTASKFNNHLRDFLGLNYGGVAASFTPASASTGGTTGLDGVSAGASSQAGKYAVSYNADSTGLFGMMKIADGNNVSYARIEKSGTQTVEFGNGLKIKLGDNFNIATNLTQRVFDVVAGESMTFDFQVAEKASDILTISVGAASLDALGLNSIDINTQEAAQQASLLIDEAQAAVNKNYAKLGAQQKQLEVDKEVLSSNVNNMQSALAEFVDADVPEYMTKMTASSVQFQIASAMLVQSNQRTQQLLSLTK